MELKATVKTKYNAKLITDSGRAALETMMLGLGAAAEKKARENVTPGVGPGPHPHISKHEDTGALQYSIFSDIKDTGNTVVVTVGNTTPPGAKINYGIILETGSVKMPAYPWLGPALAYARTRFQPLSNQAKMAFYAGKQTLVSFAKAHGRIIPGTAYKILRPKSRGKRR